MSDRFVQSVGLIVATVGALDAFISREWDLLVVFLLIVAVHLALWLRVRAARTPVSLRPDLARWIEHQAQRSGEPFNDILDRAVARYRHGLYEPSTADGLGGQDGPAP